MKNLGQTTVQHAFASFMLGLLLLLAHPTSAAAQTEADVGPLRGQPFIRMTGDVLGYELVPSFSGTYKRATFVTNRWAMRDKEYELKPPPRTYRIALLGTSFTMGGGVPDEQTHEWLLEDRLNREGPGVPRRRYEILNFAVGGYGVLQNVAVAERKVFPFAPNAALLVLQSNEAHRMVIFLAGLVRAGVPIKYPYVREKLQQAGVRPDMEEPELRRRIKPFANDLVRWSVQRIFDICREHRVAVAAIPFLEPMPRRGEDLVTITRLASETRIPLLSLDGVYEGHPLGTVRIRGDIHLNALGHQLVADRLFEALRANDAQTLKLGFSPSK
jgi:hypothetical protein